MSRPIPSLESIFHEQLQTLALTLRPGTVSCYRSAVHHFLRFLCESFPRVHRLSQLRRDPHLLAWFRRMCEQDPPFANKTRINRLVCLRRLLDDLSEEGHPLPYGLIRSADLPPLPRYLARPLSDDDDRLLQLELRRGGSLHDDALLLTRATGIRIGECIDLALDCLRQIGPDQWALHVPIGKGLAERLVPADADVRRIAASIVELRAQAPPAHLAKSAGLLLPRGGRGKLYQDLRLALADAGKRAGCSSAVTPHRLRHTYATQMQRLGVGLPALMALLGHKDIRVTMRYLLVTQQDLQREFHAARQRAAEPHRMPVLAVPGCGARADIPGIHKALDATRHLLEMYRRGLSDEKTRRRLQRLDRRLLDVAAQLDLIANAGK